MIVTEGKLTLMEASLYFDNEINSFNEAFKFNDVFVENLNITIEESVRLLTEGSSATIKMKVAEMKRKMDSDRLILKKHNIDMNAKDKIIREQVQKAVKELTNVKSSGADRTKAVGTLTNCLKEIFNFKGFTEDGIGEALVITFFISVINSVFAGIFIGLFGMGLGMAITAVAIAPITEEIAKFISIKRGHAGEFGFVFNALEFAQYLIQYGPMVGYAKMAVVRIFPVIMHYSTIIVEKYFNDKGEKTGNKSLDKIGLVIGMAIHALWNFLAVSGRLFSK
jgi:uncharacterized DUF497 family protein